jgi:hypothetical protein
LERKGKGVGVWKRKEMEFEKEKGSSLKKKGCRGLEKKGVGLWKILRALYKHVIYINVI